MSSYRKRDLERKNRSMWPFNTKISKRKKIWKLIYLSVRKCFASSLTLYMGLDQLRLITVVFRLVPTINSSSIGEHAIELEIFFGKKV